jgi:hypothetical protein
MLAPFPDYAAWERFHAKGNANPAVVTYCHMGGRRLFWIPYADPDGKTGPKPFAHIETGVEMAAGVDKAWKGGKPSKKTLAAYVKAYLGSSASSSWIDTR